MNEIVNIRWFWPHGVGNEKPRVLQFYLGEAWQNVPDVVAPDFSEEEIDRRHKIPPGFR